MIKKRLAAIDAINQVAKTKSPIPSQYKEGDQVWLEATHLKLCHQKMKLTRKHYGPFKVIKEISPIAYTVGSKTVAMFGYFALHAMWSLIAWESLLALAEWIEVFNLGFLSVF